MARKLTLTAEQQQEDGAQLKGSQRCGKRRACRRPPASDHSWNSHDSGLGSIDAPPTEAPWSGPQQGQPGPPRRALCLCGGVSSHRCEGSTYGPSRYGSYGGYPVSTQAYSRGSDFQQPWSDPFGFQPGVPKLSVERFHQGPTPAALTEREAVRKKLLAIFSARLVDAAMNMFPELMDPELLVAEILALQSHSRWLR